MFDASGAPRRMRYSFETCCRAVEAMGGGLSPGAAARTVGASRATGYRWWARFQAGGWPGLEERPSTPKRQPRRLSPAAEAEILAARERSGAGPFTLGVLLDRPASTVGKVLRWLGRSRLPREPRPPVVRYELAACPCRRRRPLPARLRRGAPQRPPGRRARVPRAGAALVPRAGARGGGGDDRQRPRLPLARLAGALRAARPAPPPHPTLHPAHQRQGRALHPDLPEKLGLRLRLPVERTPLARPLGLAQVVQQTPTPRLARRPPAHQPCLTGPWSLQLEVDVRSRPCADG